MNYQNKILSALSTFLENNMLVDCTLLAEGKLVKAHKVVLSACSPYFATLFSEQFDKHPVVILKDIKFKELQAMIDFMYKGQVNTSEIQNGDLVKVAESLQIKDFLPIQNRSTQKDADICQQKPVKPSHLTDKIKQRSDLSNQCDIHKSGESSSNLTSRKRKLRISPIQKTNNHHHQPISQAFDDKISKSSNQRQAQGYEPSTQRRKLHKEEPQLTRSELLVQPMNKDRKSVV